MLAPTSTISHTTTPLLQISNPIRIKLVVATLENQQKNITPGQTYTQKLKSVCLKPRWRTHATVTVSMPLERRRQLSDMSTSFVWSGSWFYCGKSSAPLKTSRHLKRPANHRNIFVRKTYEHVGHIIRSILIRFSSTFLLMVMILR